jgi:hypothetical protein
MMSDTGFGEEDMASELSLTWRIARKRHRCYNANAADRGNPQVAKICSRFIEPGEQYAEGENDPYRAGGFGREQFCKACADRGLA